MELQPQQFFSHGDLARVLQHELGYNPRKHEAKKTRNPRSGWQVDIGRSRSVAQPSQGEGPAEYKVREHRMGQLPADVTIGREPIKYVYRGMHVDEWAQAQQRGHIRSDQRGTIADWEGTNAAHDARSAASYLPMGHTGVIAKIRVHPDDEWFTIPHDDYLRSRKPIPLDRVVRVTEPISKDPKYGRMYR